MIATVTLFQVLRQVPEHQLQRIQVPVVNGAVLGEVRAGLAQGRRQDLLRRLQRDIRSCGQPNLCFCSGNPLP